MRTSPTLSRTGVPPRVVQLFLAAALAACGGGGGDGDTTVAGAPTPASAGAPAAPAPVPGPVAGGAPAPAPAPSAGAPAPSAGVPAPAPSAGSPSPAPPPSAGSPSPAPAAMPATFIATRLEDGAQVLPGSLAANGQVAYTSAAGTPRFYDGTTARVISTEPGTAIAANAAGMVTGFLVRSSPHLFTWQSATNTLSVVDHAPSVSTVPAAINASGQMTGTTSSRGFSNAFRRNLDGTGEGLGAIGTNALGPDPTHGLFINTSGTVAGLSATPDAHTHAALWVVGQLVRDLGTLGGANSSVAGLNDANQAAGQADLADGQQHAYRWSASEGMVDLGTLGGRTSAAAAINAAGWVVGSASSADDHTLAVLWRNGATVPLGTLGGTESMATAVNAAGQVGGQANAADGTLRAFLWSDAEGLVDLNTRVGPGLPVLQTVIALADDGTVLVMTPTGPVLLRPQPS